MGGSTMMTPSEMQRERIKTNKPCPSCNKGFFEYAERPSEIVGRGIVLTIKQKGYTCSECGSGYIETKDRETTLLAVKNFLQDLNQWPLIQAQPNL